MKTDSVAGLTNTSSQVSLSFTEIRQIIFISYDKHGLSHLSLWFCPVQKDLLKIYFNPYTIKLVSNCENNSVVTNADMQGLQSLLKQMTGCIPSINNNNLITALKNFVNGIKDLFFENSNHIKILSHLEYLISSLNEGLTAIINKLAEWKM